MKIIFSCLILLVSSPAYSQWRSVKVSSITDTNAITENFRRASLWSNRKLDRFSNDTLYGQPIFQNGVKFGDGTIQNTAIPSTSSFLIAPATFSYLNNANAFLVAPATFTILTGSYLISPSTFYIVKNTDYLASPATFSYLNNASMFLSAPATFYVVKNTDYLVSPATFTYQRDGDNLGNHIATTTLNMAGFSANYISAIYNDGSYSQATVNNIAQLNATQTFTGKNSFTDSLTASSFTATGQISVSSNTLYYAQAEPSGVTGKGVMYYDNSLNVFMVKENNGVAKPIVDPPGNWTCTIRTGASSCASNNGGVTQTATATCTGVEKMLSYSTNHAQYTAAGCATLGIDSNQWLSHGGEIITNQSVTSSYSSSWPNGYSIVSAYANCCQ